jgi:hypothetical protein
MKLHIQVENGQPVNHPALDSNLLQSFTTIPENWEPFERLQPPPLGVYEKNQTVSYQKIGGFWTDVFACEQMTQEEITAKQNMVKAAWAAGPNYKTWIFDESICQYIPTIHMPQDGKRYLWRESDESWVVVTPAPEGERWWFNVETAAWEQT